MEDAKKTAGLATKIVAIAKECSHIERDGHASHGDYRYVSAAAVLDRFGPACTKHGVATRTKFETVTPWDATITTKKGDAERFVRVKCTVELVDTETGEVWSTEGYGDGCDPRDKAIYKAQTGARRDAIKNLCNTSTKEDREEPQDPEYDAPRAPARIPHPEHQAPKASLDYVFSGGPCGGKSVRAVLADKHGPERLTWYRQEAEKRIADPKATAELKDRMRLVIESVAMALTGAAA